MWRIVIYDLCEPNEPAIAICEMEGRGEYELLNHQFDFGAYRWRDFSDSEKETLEAFGTPLPVKHICNFCLSRRHCDWTGITY